MAWYGTTRHTVLLVTHYIKHMLFKIKLLVVSLFSLYHFVHCDFIINILDNVYRVYRFCWSATMRKQVVMFNSKYFNKFITFHRILQIVIWNEQRIRMERPMHTPSWPECTLHSAHTSSLPPIHYITCNAHTHTTLITLCQSFSEYISLSSYQWIKVYLQFAHL